MAARPTRRAQARSKRPAARTRPLRAPEPRGDIPVRRMYTSHYAGYGADVLRLPPLTYVEVSERELARGFALTGGRQFYALQGGHTDEDGVTWGEVHGLFDDEEVAPRRAATSRIARRGAGVKNRRRKA